MPAGVKPQSLTTVHNVISIPARALRGQMLTGFSIKGQICRAAKSTVMLKKENDVH
jgi:hypothetical protein